MTWIKDKFREHAKVKSPDADWSMRTIAWACRGRRRGRFFD
jgi:hypothetical protein